MDPMVVYSPYMMSMRRAVDRTVKDGQGGQGPFPAMIVNQGHGCESGRKEAQANGQDDHPAQGYPEDHEDIGDKPGQEESSSAADETNGHLTEQVPGAAVQERHDNQGHQRQSGQSEQGGGQSP